MECWEQISGEGDEKKLETQSLIPEPALKVPVLSAGVRQVSAVASLAFKVSCLARSCLGARAQ